MLYALLVAFIAFFSNLSIALFVLNSNSEASFAQTVTAYKLINDLEIKTPLLINTYLANLNNVLAGNAQTNFSSHIIAETETGYFDIVNQLSQPIYSSDSLSKSIENEATSQLCTQINCNFVQNYSLSFIASSFRNRFNYWDPANGVSPNLASVNAWLN